jgi:hypothetical protein
MKKSGSSKDQLAKQRRAREDYGGIRFSVVTVFILSCQEFLQLF